MKYPELSIGENLFPFVMLLIFILSANGYNKIKGSPILNGAALFMFAAGLFLAVGTLLLFFPLPGHVTTLESAYHFGQISAMVLIACLPAWFFSRRFTKRKHEL
jgi:hypothetical protein